MLRTQDSSVLPGHRCSTRPSWNEKSSGSRSRAAASWAEPLAAVRSVASFGSDSSSETDFSCVEKEGLVGQAWISLG